MISPSEKGSKQTIRPLLDFDVNEDARVLTCFEPLQFQQLEGLSDGEGLREAGEEGEANLTRDMGQDKESAILEAWERGHTQARVEAQQEFEIQLAAEREKILACCAKFVEDRRTHAALLEAEMVKLSMAIAKKILHREAKLNPMVLQEVVRNMLDSVRNEQEINLRVTIADADLWRGLIEAQGRKDVKILDDSKMTQGQCRLEAESGVIELGVDAQLDEIETSLADLWGRPAGQV